MTVARSAGAGGARQMVAREDAIFPWYIGLAFAAALVGGFLLAVLLPLAAALQWSWGVRWRALVQVHGHLQMAGWLGLFIAGMALRLAPRFAGRPLRFAGVTRPTLILLVVRLAGRALAQPLLDTPLMRALLLISVVAELGGALLLATALAATLYPAVRTVAAAPLFILGATGVVAQAAFSALWLRQLTAEAPYLAGNRNSALLAVQFFGFVLPFVLGVSLRALPTFFARAAPTAGQTLLLAAAQAAGTTLYAAGLLLLDDATGVRLQAIGGIILAGTIAAAVAWTGVWRSPERLRDSARHVALLIRTAYAWLAAVALALVLIATRALRSGRAPLPADTDAVRHMLALGVFTTLLVGMASLMLPWLAMRRQRSHTAKREVWVLWTLLTAATVLRVGAALLEHAGVGAARFWLMGLGGVLALAAVARFALTVLRAARPTPPEIVVHERVQP